MAEWLVVPLVWCLRNGLWVIVLCWVLAAETRAAAAAGRPVVARATTSAGAIAVPSMGCVVCGALAQSAPAAATLAGGASAMGVSPAALVVLAPVATGRPLTASVTLGAGAVGVVDNARVASAVAPAGVAREAAVNTLTRGVASFVDAPCDMRPSVAVTTEVLPVRKGAAAVSVPAAAALPAAGAAVPNACDLSPLRSYAAALGLPWTFDGYAGAFMWLSHVSQRMAAVNQQFRAGQISGEQMDAEYAKLQGWVDRRLRGGSPKKTVRATRGVIP